MLNDRPMNIAIFISISIHLLFLVLPNNILRFTPTIEASREFIAQIVIEKPSSLPKKIKKYKLIPKPKSIKPKALVKEEPVIEPGVIQKVDLIQAYQRKIREKIEEVKNTLLLLKIMGLRV